ncbi:hypothetical protein CDSM653_00635 [Caldanaerobacter subterraneus subsp. pacificus DSM 12653]|uniref:Uncharacterized protein n=1 Tax=Caldanaerobacter subterraneus subsp. pacificus DSM 12653 TaxID=391606 RepID=A0A0F5PPH3_9THEO|nr:hypothetical protein CDSM653_00635 [Caldanaerobacter subterraneus subsp. pacificus DSM 12653]
MKDAKWSERKNITPFEFENAWQRALEPKTGSLYDYHL